MLQPWKVKFLDLCNEFTDIKNYRPAKYHGFYGNIDNSIDFVSIPPPTHKVYMPKYSDEMNEIWQRKWTNLISGEF